MLKVSAHPRHRRYMRDVTRIEGITGIEVIMLFFKRVNRHD